MVLLNWYFDLILSNKKPMNVVNKTHGPESRYHKNVFLESFLLYPCDERLQLILCLNT